MKYSIMEFGEWKSHKDIKIDCNDLAEQIQIGDKLRIKGIGVIVIASVCIKNNGDILYLYDKLIG